MDLMGDSNDLLEVTRIDPQTEVAKYSEPILAKAAEHLDQEGLALLREDLRSPCTEEIAVFRAFADAVDRGQDRFVVIDTAPTGHTILLMDATEAYHREVGRTQSDAPESVRQLLPWLRNPDFVKVVLVALPEPTPVHEAMKLKADLARAGIGTFGWVLNRSFSAAGVTEPLLASSASREFGPMSEVVRTGDRLTILPWSASPLGQGLAVPAR